MKLSFSIAILFSLVIASGLGLVHAQSTPPPIELSEWVSYCDEMPRETLEEKIEKRECRVEEAQRGVDEADPSRVPWWQEQLEKRQAGLDKLLAKQAEEAATTPVPEDMMATHLETLATQMEARKILRDQLRVLSSPFINQIGVLSDQIQTTESAILLLKRESLSQSSPFILDPDNSTPTGITSLNDKFWVTDRDDHKVYAYNAADGTRDAASDFDLDPDNDFPYIMSYDGKLYVKYGLDTKSYAYNAADGTRDAASDFDDFFGFPSPGRWPSTPPLDGKVYVVDSVDSKIYAYNITDGTRVAISDFDYVYGDDIELTGALALDGKLYLINYDGTVLVYNLDGTFAYWGWIHDKDGFRYHNGSGLITVYDGEVWILDTNNSNIPTKVYPYHPLEFIEDP